MWREGFGSEQAHLLPCRCRVTVCKRLAVASMKGSAAPAETRACGLRALAGEPKCVQMRLGGQGGSRDEGRGPVLSDRQAELAARILSPPCFATEP